MKKLVITDKGIGIAEMPEEPDGYALYSGVEDYSEYEYAVNLAIASAPLFEDQERVKMILFKVYCETTFDNGHNYLGNGTYPIPPDFPEYVEVKHTKYKTRYAHDDAKKDKIFLRFVDKQEQRNHLVELMKEDEKHGMYEESQEDQIRIPTELHLAARTMSLGEYEKWIKESFTIKRK